MQHDPQNFWSQIAELKTKAPRKDGKRDLTQVTAQLIDAVSSWVNEPQAVKNHYEYAYNQNVKYKDLQSVCVLLRDNFSFSKRLVPDFCRSTRSLDLEALHLEFLKLLEARIQDLLPQKSWLASFNQYSTEDCVISRTNSTQSLYIESDTDTANTSGSSGKSSETMTDIEKVSFSGVKLRTPKEVDEETDFKQYNAQFILWLKANHIKIKEDISDASKKEDPAIVMAYRATIAQHKVWRSAVSRAVTTNEGKNADLKKVMQLASKILQPAEKSMFQLCMAMSQARQTDQSYDGCLQHYEKIRELKENPVLSDFKEPWFAFLLLHGSIHYERLMAGTVDIETDSLEKIQERIEQIQLRSEMKNETTVSANFSRSKEKRFDRKFSQNKSFKKEKKTKFFCKMHGECNHSTNKCTDIADFIKKSGKSRSSNENGFNPRGKQVKQVANEEYPDSSSDNYSDYGEDELPHCAAVRTYVSNITAAPRVFTNILCEKMDGSKSVNVKAQVDTAADITVAPYHVAQNLNITNLSPLTSDIFSFDNKKATDQFAGRAEIKFKILEKIYKTNVLFLKPQVGQRRMLLGLDILSRTHFNLSCNGTKWNFEFKDKPAHNGRTYVQMIKTNDSAENWVFQPGQTRVDGCKVLKKSSSNVVATPRVFTNVTCENIDGSKSIEVRSQVDTAADMTIAPYHVIKSLGVDNLTPVTKDVYSFHNEKATDKFAGQASINFRILGKTYNTNVLFLKPRVGRPTMLLGLDILSRTSFHLSYDGTKWNFEFNNEPCKNGSINISNKSITDGSFPKVMDIFTDNQNLCYAEKLCDVAGVDPEQASLLMDIEEKISLTMSLHHEYSHAPAHTLKSMFTDILPGIRTIERILCHCHSCADKKDRAILKLPDSSKLKNMKPPKRRIYPEILHDKAKHALQEMVQNKWITKVSYPEAKLGVMHVSFTYPIIQNKRATVMTVSDDATNKVFFVRLDSKDGELIAQSLQILFSNIGAPKQILCDEELSSSELNGFLASIGSKLDVLSTNNKKSEHHHRNLKECLAKNPTYSLARAQMVINDQPLSDVKAATVIFTPTMLFDEFNDDKLCFFLKHKKHLSDSCSESEEKLSKLKSITCKYSIGTVVKLTTLSESRLYHFGVVVSVDESSPNIVKIETTDKKLLIANTSILEKIDIDINTMKRLLSLGNRRQ